VDAHHGDGVQHAFLGDPRVLTVSIHQHPATLWPNTGWSSEVGSGAAEGATINLPVLPGTVDSVWLRGFHAVVPAAMAAFKPQIVISQCGVDSHREDPLADLSLTVDGQRAAFLAMRQLADRYAEGRWLAVGGGGYGLVRVVPRAWTHLIAAALDRDIDPALAVPQSWRDRVSTLAPSVELPETMGDGSEATYLSWDGPGGTPETGVESMDRALVRVDSAIAATRRAAFPLLGLDPEDPRD
jgi:acetoin utilization protein AcuC